MLAPRSAVRSTLAFVAVAALLGAAPPLAGTFALETGHAATRGYLRATSTPKRPLVVALDVWLTEPASPTSIRAYDVDMTKLLHTIVVDDEFSSFAHIHPSLTRDGHFRIVYAFPRAGNYHIYADATPHGIGQQVFRFDLPVATARPMLAARRLPPPNPTAHAGPYTVTLDRTVLSTRAPTALRVRIRRDGRLANDLHPYLGALAHAVFLNARDLGYVHVHPSAYAASGTMATSGTSGMAGMPGMDAAPLADAARSAAQMLLRAPACAPGPYELWLQFRGGGALRVARFTLTTR